VCAGALGGVGVVGVWGVVVVVGGGGWVRGGHVFENRFGGWRILFSVHSQKREGGKGLCYLSSLASHQSLKFL